jgi:hypothetical protein
MNALHTNLADIGSTEALVDPWTGETAVPDLDDATVIAVNAAGNVVGSRTDGGRLGAWLWRDGRLVALPYLGGGSVVPTAVNARGDVVGVATGGGATTAVIWPAAAPGTVRALDGTGTVATAIGDDGIVCGTREVAGVPTPVLWDTSRPQR